MEKLKDFLKPNLKVKDAGFLEYLFSVTAVISALPSVIVYLILVKLIVQPVKALVEKVWK